MKGALRIGWVKAHVIWSPCLGWVSWSSSQRHTAPRMLCCVRAVHVKLPLEPSTATDSRDWRGRWLSLHISSSSPADLISWDWPNLGQKLRAVGPRVTAPLRTHYSLQTKAPGGFDHHLCTLLNSFVYLLFCYLFLIWSVGFSDILWVWAPNVIYGLQFFCRLTFHPTDCWRDSPFPTFLS